MAVVKNKILNKSNLHFTPFHYFTTFFSWFAYFHSHLPDRYTYIRFNIFITTFPSKYFTERDPHTIVNSTVMLILFSGKSSAVIIFNPLYREPQILFSVSEWIQETILARRYLHMTWFCIKVSIGMWEVITFLLLSATKYSRLKIHESVDCGYRLIW